MRSGPGASARGAEVVNGLGVACGTSRSEKTTQAVVLHSACRYAYLRMFSDTRAVLVERSMHPGYLSNAYVVADEEGGTAVYVDSGAPMEPLFEAVERWRATPVAVLRTHGHGDHVEHEDELRVEVVTGDFESGGLRVEALPTPGHSDDGLSFVV